MNMAEVRFWVERIGRWERQGLTDSTGMPADPNPFPRFRLFRGWRR